MALLATGLYGLLIKRNLIRLVVVVQILVKGAVLALVLAGAATDQLAMVQSLAVTILVGDAVVAMLGLALAVQMKQRFGTLDVETLRRRLLDSAE